MKCTIQGCPGQYKDELLTLVKHRNGQVIVIDNVPAQVCDFCGEELISPETVRQMERIKQATMLEPIATAPVYDFSQGATVQPNAELAAASRLSKSNVKQSNAPPNNWKGHHLLIRLSVFTILWLRVGRYKLSNARLISAIARGSL